MLQFDLCISIIGLILACFLFPQVLDVLCSLCIGNNVAVRSNQSLICDNLLPRRDLLLQTKVVDYVYRSVFLLMPLRNDDITHTTIVVLILSASIVIVKCIK